MESIQINFKQQRDFNQLLNSTFEFIKQEFKPLAKSVIYFAGPFILIYSFFLGLSQSAIYSNPKNLFGQSGFSSMAYMLSIEYMIALIFALISSVMVMTTVYSYVKCYNENGKGNFTTDDVWAELKNQFLKVFGTTLLYGLIMIITGIVSIIALEIPLIYLTIATSVLMPIRIFENQGFGNSFTRSMYLIRDNWWKTFGFMIVIYLIVSFAGSIFIIPQTIVSMFYMFSAITSDGEGGTSILLIILTTVGSFCATLLYSVIYIAVSFNYYSLVEQKESPTLMQKIQEIE